MGQTLNLKAKGLYLYQNDFTEVPEGALLIADDVEIKREGIVESRRGFNYLDNAFSGLTHRAHQLFDFKTKLLAHYNTNRLAYYDDSLGWVTYSDTILPADDTLGRLKTAIANNNLYFMTAKGVMKLEDYNSQLVEAGCPKGLDLDGSLSGSSGFFATAKVIAYRILWGIKDANNNVIYGAVSQRFTIDNTSGGARDVALTSSIPAGITTSHFYQVYRSAQFDTGVDPDDELQLVYEANPTAGEITAGLISFTDDTPDDLRGATIYTAASQEGIEKNNEQPPFAKTADVFREYMFYGNTIGKQRLIFTILSAASITEDDVLTIAGVNYTAKTAEDIGALEFKIYSGGSTAQNIRDTAQSLIRVINRNTSNSAVYAYYLSGVDDLPGKILIEARTVAGAAFTAQASANGDAYSPDLTAAQSSSQDVFKNGLFYSKAGQPEAVPLLNYFFIGNSSNDILKVLASRDSLFIFKTDGIFRLTGFSEENFRVEQFDATSQLLAPDSCVKLNNKVYMLSTQGVVEVSETGVSVVSRPIESVLLELFGKDLSGMKKYTFAVPYETDRKYCLFMIDNKSQTYARQAYVYNFFTNTWTHWVMKRTCGLIKESDDLMYLGNGETNKISQERKGYTYTDYVDEKINDYNVVGFSGSTVSLDSTSGLTVGDLLYQSSSKYSVITGITPATNTVTVNYPVTWLISSVSAYRGINCRAQFNHQAAGNLYANKHFREVMLPFKNSFFVTGKVGFSSNYSRTVEYVDVSGQGLGVWGAFPWGSLPWGGVSYTKPIRTLVPRQKARCSWLKVEFVCRSSYSKFLLDGVCFTYNMMNERVTR